MNYWEMRRRLKKCSSCGVKKDTAIPWKGSILCFPCLCKTPHKLAEALQIARLLQRHLAELCGW